MKMPLLIIPNLGPGELAVIVLVILLLFGAKRIPEFARSIGQGMKEFKKSVSGIGEELSEDEKNERPPASKD